MIALEPAALLWDMDGTIVDTEPYWMSAETELVESFGGTWTHEEAIGLVGSGLGHSARVLQGKGVTLDAEAIIEALTTRVLEQVAVAIPWRPGALELLAEAAAAGVPMALVTMSIRRMAESIAQALPTPFDVIVGGDDVAHSKPHPEPYLRGAELLGVDAANCVAIEDSAPGVASAIASGAVVIGVPLYSTIPDTGGYTVWPTLAGRSLSDVFELYARERSAGVDA